MIQNNFSMGSLTSPASVTLIPVIVEAAAHPAWCNSAIKDTHGGGGGVAPLNIDQSLYYCFHLVNSHGF